MFGIRIIRLAIAIWALFNVAIMEGRWVTANKPFERGGALDNPFNDPAYFCCVWKRAPCKEIPHWQTCVMDEALVIDENTVNIYAKTQWPWVAWTLFYVVAIVLCLVDKYGLDDEGGGFTLKNPVLFALVAVVIPQFFKPVILPPVIHS